MANDEDLVEVDFEKYCPLCSYKDLKESKDPCNECLTTPANYNSAKPIKWKEHEK